MIDSRFTPFLSAFVGIAAGFAIYELQTGSNRFTRLFKRYAASWAATVRKSGSDPIIRAIPTLQLLTIPPLGFAAYTRHIPALGWTCAAFLILPPLWLLRARKKQRNKLEDDLDGFLTNLADSLTAVPNLSEAVASLHPNLVSPIREEVGTVLAEIRIGRSIDDALTAMAARIRLSGLDAAVGALILSRRVGGDIPKTLRRIAETVREMARLEGVIRTKTAEGRTQAWVIGLMPPGLVLYFEKINPEWLAPMWNDPIGWALLGAAALAEIAALALIRKIMAVDI